MNENDESIEERRHNQWKREEEIANSPFLHGCLGGGVEYPQVPQSPGSWGNNVLPAMAPNEEPQPFLPLLAPSPLMPFLNNHVPHLSGHCPLNFSAAKSMLSTTAIDCWDFYAPFLANVICCPQLEATLLVLIGQTSKDTGSLALDENHIDHCLSDIDQILVGQGASKDLKRICSIQPSNLTESSCPVKDMDEFENIVEPSKLLSACEDIDPVKECCSQACENAILEAASTIAMKNHERSTLHGSHILPQHTTRIDDCKSIVRRWLASQLDPSAAKNVFRGLSNCNVNKVCPLTFPDMKNVTKDCDKGISHPTACCSALRSYVSELQTSFITNLQAVNCAASLALKLKKANITKNVYMLCHITLKDFSLQESGCLLQSLPSDAAFDESSGIVGFQCDLNDNIAAPWPLTAQLPASSCNKTIRIPALPVATSGQSGRNLKKLMILGLVSSLMVLTTVV
ncbi:hypothetical protein Sjap_003214 [Stephania japonica]|uniref:SPARK domain-containing protein n=1 Tax=Stephania japonica TaxID=461633 RepID=A0AAP0KQ26_9MAGN